VNHSLDYGDRTPLHDSPDRRAALRAQRQFLAARRAGDMATATIHLDALKHHVDAHIEAIRAGRRRLP
jgi:hypothetical protein